MKSFLKQLDDLSEKTVIAENSDYDKISAIVHNRTNELKIPVRKTNRYIKSKAVRIFAASIALVIVLTFSAAALNDWNFSNVFGELFKSGDNIEFELPHTIKPEINNIVNPLKNIDLEVLGIAGDDKALYIVVEFKGNIDNIKDYEFSVYDFTPFGAEKSLFGFAPLGTEESKKNAQSDDAEFMNYSMNTLILSETKNNVIMAFGFEFISNFTLEKGYLHFTFYDRNAANDNESYEESMARCMFFDVLIDYEFWAKKIFEVNKITNMPAHIGDGSEWDYGFNQGPIFPIFLKSVEITPIAVRFTTNSNGNYFVTNSVLIKFKNGDTLFSGIDSLGISGGGEVGKDITHRVHFNTPYDLNDIYSVTVGDIEIVF